MSEPDDFPKTIISLRTALILYGVLAVIACFTLTGYVLGLGLIIIGGAAVKAYVHHVRSRMEE